MKLIALSGSLRQRSHNKSALLALQESAPEGVEISVASISELPLFNPDLEDSPIASVLALKSELASASGLIIASPEYAHGISGPMKNALDWLVSGSEFPDVPIMLINTSPRASHSIAALKEVLTTMSGNVIEEALLTLPLLGTALTAQDMLADSEIRQAIDAKLTAFINQIGRMEPRLGFCSV